MVLPGDPRGGITDCASWPRGYKDGAPSRFAWENARYFHTSLVPLAVGLNSQQVFLSLWLAVLHF